MFPPKPTADPIETNVADVHWRLLHGRPRGSGGSVRTPLGEGCGVWWPLNRLAVIKDQDEHETYVGPEMTYTQPLPFLGRATRIFRYETTETDEHGVDGLDQIFGGIITIRW
jgi:hypothetical protein